MAYGEKYYSYFRYDNKTVNSRYYVSILEDSYVSTASEIPAMGIPPLLIECDGQEDTKDSAIFSSRAVFQFVADKDDVATYDADFLEGAYKNKKMIVYAGTDVMGTSTTTHTHTMDVSYPVLAQAFNVTQKTEGITAKFYFSGAVGGSYNVYLVEDNGGEPYTFNSKIYDSKTITSAASVSCKLTAPAYLNEAQTYWVIISGNTGETIKTQNFTNSRFTKLLKGNGGAGYGTFTEVVGYRLTMTIDPLYKKFEGFIRADNSYREFYGNKYTYKVEASDGLADLAEYDYKNITDDSPYTGYTTGITIIKRALSNVGIELPFRVQLGTYDKDEMTSSECALYEISHNQSVLYDNDDSGEVTYNKCNTAITKILDTYGVTLRQVDGYYWINNRHELDSFYFDIDWAVTGAQRRGDYTASGDPVDFTVDVDSYAHLSRGQLTKIPPVIEYTEHVNRFVDTGNLVTDGGFDSDTTYWNNAAGGSAFSQFSMGADEYAGMLKLTNLDDVTSYAYSDDFAAAVDIEADTDQFTISLRATSQNLAGSAVHPSLQFALYGPTGGGAAETTSGAWSQLTTDIVTYSQTIDMTGKTDGDYHLRIYADFATGTTTSNIYIDDVQVLQQAPGAAYDVIHRNARTAGFKFITKDLYYRDEPYSYYSDALLAGAVLTSGWNRYDKTDETNIKNLRAQNYLNNHSGYKDYLKCNIYDPDENIRLWAYLVINSKEYEIIGYSFNPWEASYDLELIEILTPADVAYNSYSETLLTTSTRD